MKLKSLFLIFTLFYSAHIFAEKNNGSSLELRKYVNDKYGFALSYPLAFAAGTDFSTSYFLGKNWSNHSTETMNNPLQDAVWQVEIQNTEGKAKDHEKYYYQAYVRVGVSSSPEDVANCEKMPTDLKAAAEPHITQINHQAFNAFYFSDNAMDQFKSGTTYRRLHNDKCYSIEYIETGSSTANIANYDVIHKRNALAAKKIIDSFVFTDDANKYLPNITSKGLGEITATTPYDLDKIKTFFPEYTVQAVTATTEDMPFETLVVSNDKEDLLTILHTFDVPKSKKILCLVTKSKNVGNDLGAALGDSYSQVYAKTAAAKCMPGIEEMSGYVICRAPGSENIYYTFKGVWDGVDGTVPPLSVLNNWVMEEIIWVSAKKYAEGLNQFCHVAVRSSHS